MSNNIFDAKSGFKFIVYANPINATFGVYFLKFVILFVRSFGYDLPIRVFFDWGIEFISNSPSKLNEWNGLFPILNTTCSLYDGPKDSRKNLLKDPTGLMIPRGYYINSKQSFLDDCIFDLIYYTKTIDTYKALLSSSNNLNNPKAIIDFKYKLNIHNNIFTQNVFELYGISFLYFLDKNYKNP